MPKSCNTDVNKKVGAPANASTKTELRSKPISKASVEALADVPAEGNTSKIPKSCDVLD